MNGRATSEMVRFPGSILFEGEDHPCVILERSLTGAVLADFGALILPDTFMLRLGPTNSFCVRCWVISQDGTEARVSFVRN